METNIPEWEQKKAELKLAEKIGDAVADGAVTGYKAIEHGVVTGYHKIEDGVVSGYHKIEDSVVGGFTKISDKFVDAFLTKEGETVEDAKARLAAQQSVQPRQAGEKKGEDKA